MGHPQRVTGPRAYLPDDATAEARVVKRRWPTGVCCTSCGSLNVNTATKRKDMPNRVRKELSGRGPVGKTAVVGTKDRATKQVAVEVVRSTDKETLQGFIGKVAAEGAKVYTDDARAYETLPFDHDSVKHSLKQYVKGDVHTNGIESLWGLLKRCHKGVYHNLTPKHFDLYVQEFAGRRNLREEDTMDMMAAIVGDAAGTQLRNRDLIAPDGLSSHARELGSSESGGKPKAGERVC